MLDAATKFAFFKKNKLALDNIRHISHIDPILEFEDFKKEVIRYKNAHRTRWLGINEIGGDSPLYGHLNSLCEYAGRKYHDYYRLFLPAIEHGIGWLDSPNVSEFPSFVHCIISQGPYRHNYIRRQSNMPHYIIGPYIHYSNPYYSDTNLNILKKKLGKTLLVFPAHTYEFATISYAKKKYVNDLMKGIAKDFDSIIVSAYWNDVDDPLFSYFKTAGAYIVSSGLREDFNFLPRLKSLLLLTDVTTGNSLGTNIGYSIYLGKPFIYFDGNNNIDFKDSSYSKLKSTNISKQLDSIYNYGKSIFIDTNNYKIASPQQKSFYLKYCGGKKYIKSPEEVNALFNISFKALKASYGDTRSLQHVYSQKIANTLPENTTESQLLKEALK